MINVIHHGVGRYGSESIINDRDEVKTLTDLGIQSPVVHRSTYKDPWWMTYTFKNAKGKWVKGGQIAMRGSKAGIEIRHASRGWNPHIDPYANHFAYYLGRFFGRQICKQGFANLKTDKLPFEWTPSEGHMAKQNLIWGVNEELDIAFPNMSHNCKFGDFKRRNNEWRMYPIFSYNNGKAIAVRSLFKALRETDKLINPHELTPPHG